MTVTESSFSALHISSTMCAARSLLTAIVLAEISTPKVLALTKHLRNCEQRKVESVLDN